METNDLIERLRTESLYIDKATLEIMDLCMEAAEQLEVYKRTGFEPCDFRLMESYRTSAEEAREECCEAIRQCGYHFNARWR